MSGLTHLTGLSPTPGLTAKITGLTAPNGLTNVDVTYDPAASAFFAAVTAAGGTLTPTDKTNYNTYIVALKTAGVWQLLDFNYLAGPSQTVGDIDLVSLASLTPVASPAWVNSQGYTGNGTSSYVQTPYVTKVSSHFQQNSGHFSAYNRTSRASPALTALVGNNNSVNGESFLIPLFSACFCGISDAAFATNSVGPPANAQGFWLVNRTSSTAADIRLKDVSQGTLSDPSVSPNVADPWLIGCLFQTGAPNYLSTDQIASMTVGATLTSGEATALYNATQAFFTAYGTQV